MAGHPGGVVIGHGCKFGDEVTRVVWLEPYLGNYEHGWRVERRDDETLWMARSGWEFQLLPTPDGYIVSSGVALGAQVAFTKDADGKLKFGISYDGSSTDFAKLM